MPEATRFSPIQGVPRKFARGPSSYEEGMGGLPRTIMASNRDLLVAAFPSSNSSFLRTPTSVAALADPGPEGDEGDEGGRPGVTGAEPPGVRCRSGEAGVGCLAPATWGSMEQVLAPKTRGERGPRR